MKRLYNRTCEYCGKKFQSPNNAARFCCKECVYGGKMAEKERPFTKDTQFLCRKWHSEGMSVQEIAKMLCRSSKNVEKALAVKL